MKTLTLDAVLWEGNEFLELAEASAGIGVWDVDLATQMVRGRPQFFRVMGLEPTLEPVSIEVFRALRHPDDREGVVDGFRHNLTEGNDFYEREYRIIRPDGELRWILGRGRVIRDAAGQPVRYSGVDIDITDRKMAEAALAASDQRYRELVQRANDIVATLDLEGRLTSINPVVETILGYAPEELIGRSLGEFVPPEEMPMHETMLSRKMAGENATRYEMHFISKGGRRLTLEIDSQLIHDAGNRPTGIHSIARDITERKDAEARQALLVAEVQHRAKNLLAVTQSIVRSTIKTSQDLNTADERIASRLQALARAQQFMNVDTSGASVVAIAEIVQGELDAFGERIVATGPSVLASSAFAQMFALVIHELATNATKHGALSIPGGRVYVQWMTQNDAFSFSWIERDGPPVLQPATSGFGSKLIRAALGESPRISYSKDGFEYEVGVPLENLRT